MMAPVVRGRFNVADAPKMLSVPFDDHAPVLVAQYRPTSGTQPSKLLKKALATGIAM
jgi:hypothetical protein